MQQLLHAQAQIEMIERLVEFKRQRKLYAWKNERSVTFRAATPFKPVGGPYYPSLRYG